MGNILSYFDLNKRRAALATEIVPIPGGPLRGIEETPPKGADLPIWQQIAFYLGTLLGVVASSAITQFKEGKQPILTISMTTVLISAVIAMIIIPNFYVKVIKEETPFIVQLGLCVQNGVFWSVALTAIGKTIS